MLRMLCVGMPYPSPAVIFGNQINSELNDREKNFNCVLLETEYQMSRDLVADNVIIESGGETVCLLGESYRIHEQNIKDNANILDI